MSVLVDTSVWIDYFRSGKNSVKLDFLIDENLVVINKIILAELVPFLRVKNQRKIIKLLYHIQTLNLAIDWEQIMEFQFKCLLGGLNGIGIPDLLIAQNARQNQCKIYSLDRHFTLMKEIFALDMLK